MGDDLSTTKKYDSKNDIHEDMQSLKNQTKENSADINFLLEQNQELKDMIGNLTENLSQVLSKRQAPIDSAVLKRVRKNKREIIKNRVVELISAKKYSVSDIKEIVVDKEQYCSKATFYRYIDEMKESFEEINLQGRNITIPKISLKSEKIRNFY